MAEGTSPCRSEKIVRWCGSLWMLCGREKRGKMEQGTLMNMRSGMIRPRVRQRRQQAAS